ncbi:helix-loop-helix DNA-binding domain-containing protein [Rhodotorula diobovata]|uniref:Helix-loop-helix DNA-binding domain-containing protein n=1 Tax=Rhodotorula diobovata TaxID=5288 RepID=A0A5C5FLC6_9BASI|nr:helix-loop-helix DNA-binding domain-containing protein [Rhodotorula diobovata]
MATFFGHAPPTASGSNSQPSSDAPIKMQGFALPPLPLPHPPSAPPPPPPPPPPPGSSQALAAFAHLYPQAGVHSFPHLGGHHQPGPGGIDPSMLLGFSAHGPSHLDHTHFGSLGNGGFGHPAGTSVLSDADLDFESVLASLGAAAHQHQQHQQQQQQQAQQAQHAAAQGHYGSHGGTNGGQQHADLFGAGGMFDQAAMHPPPPATGHSLNGQQLSPRLQLDHMPSYFTQPPPLSHSHSHPHSHPHSLPKQQQHDAFPSPALPSAATTTATTTTTTNARSSKSSERGTSSKRSVSTERTGRTGRTAATGAGSVGKAPRQSRSRSARRSSSAAGYDRDRPSPSSRESGGRRGAAGARDAEDAAGTEPSPAATPGAAAAGASNGAGAVGIPASASTTTTTSGVPDPAQQYAMSLPAYSSASLSGTPSSLPAGGAWGALAAAHPHAFPAHAFNSASPGSGSGSGGGGGVPVPGAQSGSAAAADAASGWRPSPPGSGTVASAPPATGLAGRSPTAGGGVKAPGSSKKGKGLADVQEEDDGKGDPLSEKRRKRRESHNAVERRRRDNINDRIAELSLLVPETFLAPGSPPGDVACMLPPVDEGPASPAIGALSLRSPGPSSAAVLGGSPSSAPGAGFAARGAAQQAEKLSAQQLAAKEKPNKGVVLAKSVEYIKYLQHMVELSQQHAVELQRQNAVLRDALAAASSSNSNGAQHPRQQHDQHQRGAANPPSFPTSTAASSFTATTNASSPASPRGAAAGRVSALDALGLGLESPSAGGDPAAASFFDFGPSPPDRDNAAAGPPVDDGGEDEGGAEDDGGRGGGRTGRAGERAWSPMLEGIDGLSALKEEDMDET